jgi:hypothetical protein
MGNGKICTDNVTHIKISNKLTPSINYFLILHRNGRIESQSPPRAGYHPRLVLPVQWLTPVQ